MKMIAAAAGAGLLAAAIPITAAEMWPYHAEPQPYFADPLPIVYADHLRPCLVAMEELGIEDEFRARLLVFMARQFGDEHSAQQQLMGVGFTVGACTVAERLAGERLLSMAE